MRPPYSLASPMALARLAGAEEVAISWAIHLGVPAIPRSRKMLPKVAQAALDTDQRPMPVKAKATPKKTAPAMNRSWSTSRSSSRVKNSR